MPTKSSHQPQRDSVYRMRIAETQQLTDAACDDVVMRMLLEPMPGETLQLFIPGQFVKLGMQDINDPAPSYFAIASAPSDTQGYEFVIKCGSPMADYLTKLPVGALVEVEGPMGKGFDLTGFKGSDVILMGVGTGVAPLRSTWRWLIEHREDYGKIKIYAGFLTAFHLLLTDEMAGLGEHHIDVSVSLATGHDGWQGPIGYVQHALEADALNGENAVACLAGMSAMVDACSETLQNIGFNDSHILLNF